MENAASRKSFFYTLRYRRDRYRQALGIGFVILVSLLARPVFMLAVVGLLLVVFGVAIRLWASGHIHKNHELARDGPYAFVRHPLYVGNIFLLVGFALASNLWWSWLLLAVILVGFYPPAIRREDAFLAERFGDTWRDWHAGTRALLPRFDDDRPWREGQWSFTQSLKQNGEPLIAVFLLSCAALLVARLP